MTMVDWMMSQSWGHSPSDLGMLKELKHAFKTTSIAEAAGIAACFDSMFAFPTVFPCCKEAAKFGVFVPIDPKESTVLDVMLILGIYGAHRVWLVNSPGSWMTRFSEYY